MLIAACSDTHLGYRALTRTTPQGINQREFDVMLSFRATLNEILSHKPDLVIHAGDLFHVVKPSNHTITEAYRALTEFQRARNWAPLVLVGGNHDTPKTADVGNIQRLIAQIPGVRFAAQSAERFILEELDCEVLCVPSNALVAREEILYRPTENRRFSVLAVHGMASQALPKAVELQHADFDVLDLHANLFDYVALGDYHVHSVYGPNCCFSGSTDFTTSNIWEEAGSQKGFVLFDTATTVLRHVAIPTRPVIDLPIIDADGQSPEMIAAEMIKLATCLPDVPYAENPAAPIARQRIVNLHALDRQALHRLPAIRELQARCLNYQVKITAPLRDTGTGESPSSLAPATIEEAWRDHALLANLPAGWSSVAFTDSGLEILKETIHAAN